MAYFNYFPTTFYDMYGDTKNLKVKLATNILIRVRKKMNITKAIIISEILIPDTPLFQTSANKFLKFSNTFINFFHLVAIIHLLDWKF